MTITLNTLTTALEEATADYSVTVRDETILALRNALVDIANSNEHKCMNINVRDDIEYDDDTKYYIADLMLTKACNIASDFLNQVSFCSTTLLKESDLNYENIAWKAINLVNEIK